MAIKWTSELIKSFDGANPFAYKLLILKTLQTCYGWVYSHLKLVKSFI